MLGIKQHKRSHKPAFKEKKGKEKKAHSEKQNQ